MIATDLDGTLLDGSSQVNDRTRVAVQRAVDAGIEVVAATGRSFRTAHPKLAEVSVNHIVCSNGGAVFDRTTEAITATHPMSGAVAADVIARVGAANEDAGFGWETAGGFRFDSVFEEVCPQVDEIRLGEDPGPLRDDMEIVKMFICIRGLRRLDLQKAVLASLPAGATASASGSDFVETTAAGVDKATTLQTLCDARGITASQVIAFGDNLNDVAMLQWAGWSVAMGNAHNVVADQADEIAMSNMDDGVAVFIERWLAPFAALRGLAH